MSLHSGGRRSEFWNARTNGRFAGRTAVTLRRLAASLGVTLVIAAGLARAQPSQRGVAVVPGGLYADSWAVIVGINDYQHPRVPKLRYAVNDALAMEKALLAQGFRSERITRLVDREATKARIEEILGDELRRRVGAQDRVLIFFAGHGKTDRLRTGEEEGYLIPVDGDPGRLFSTAISMTAIRQISDRLPAKHILYVVDACYSGYALYNRAIADDLLEEMVKKPAIQILTAGRQQDVAQERRGHGVFTEVLLRGLQGDAFAGKRWLALEELGLWVKQRVYAESNKQQLPQYGSLSGEGQFVFLNAAPRPGPAAAQAPTTPPASAGLSPSQVAAVPPAGVRIESSPPGAEVYWDARPAGKTPLALSSADPGRHQLVLVLEGYATVIEDVEVTAGQPLVIAKKLEEHAGSLEVLTKPSGARIELDDVPVGTTPQKLARVHIGKHRVRVSHGDYEAVEREVAVEYEQLARLEVELAPKPGRLLVTSTPGQAEVWLGDRKLGVTVWAGELPPGQHQIRVVKDGYEDQIFDLLVDPNDAKSLDVRLKRDFGEMVLVPAGEFWMGSTPEQVAQAIDACKKQGNEEAWCKSTYERELPQHRVALDAYYIDQYDVTNALFERFVNATGYRTTAEREGHGLVWQRKDVKVDGAVWREPSGPGSAAAPPHPVVQVSWEDADAYCQWAGKRLPSEAEWEKAARGTDGRLYPWGDAWDPDKANGAMIVKTTSPVGGYPDGVSPYGAHDMAGNVFQWVADWYSKEYYQQSPPSNPKGPDFGQSRVLRGGSWNNHPVNVRTVRRSASSPGARYDYVGFRCARGAP